MIAEKEKIKIVPKPSDVKGVSGGIIFHENTEVTIFHSTDIKNEGFRNFTIGHELGHYFLPGHPEEIEKSGGVHASRAGFSQGDSSIELEADHFSAGLLMPTYLVQSELNKRQIGLEGIIALAQNSKCSVNAAAI